MGRIRDHLTYANVMATLAVFLVLSGGTAVALGGANTVQSDDLGPGSQVTAPDVAANAVNGSDVLDNSLRGPDIVESSLGRVPSATLGGLGRNGSVGGDCDPESTTLITCVATDTINLPAPTRVLIIGQISAVPEVLGSTGTGNCYVGSSVEQGYAGQTAFVRVGDQSDHIALSGVTTVLGPGPVQFGIDCSQGSGAIRYELGHVSVVELSPG